ncbi:di-heme-cytochrome C peroxidase [Microvirga massiliensis]|uniref:di-heme-cytochrome C peroxidase n=1 Tax=Microvirga massiliensis TaxID=1033741 RepID=UPI00062BE143|nr:di-heme-cytochrome C peroxidase [Microvirga massiliensis]
MKLGSLYLLCVMGVASPCFQAGAEVGFLDQGWSKETREAFYFTSQGSRMIPYAWFMALERPVEPSMFADTENLRRYGFVPADSAHPLNPDALPIGFAIDTGEPSRTYGEVALGHVTSAGPSSRGDLGLTCAACHTSNVSVDGKLFRVDGAPAHLDFDSFYADLSSAVTRTLLDPAKFERFAARVLGQPSVTGAAELRLQLAAFQTRMAGETAMRRPVLASGFGRVDALSQIINSLSVRDQGDPANLRSVEAPTSYPPLWLTPDLEFVQWNPIASSPIGRNGGEVLGVFGVTTLKGDQKDWFTSSIRLYELHAMERWVSELRPPRWDEEAFGRIQTEVADAGERLFGQHCAGCHNAPPYRRTDPAANAFKKTFIEIGRVNYKSLGVDPLYTESLAQRLVQTNAATASAGSGKSIVPAAVYFRDTVAAVINRAMDDAKIDRDTKLEMSGYRLRPPKTPDGLPGAYEAASLTDLKAGPLAGLWATGPYLHNGSVPTVYELLSPVEERRKVFWTGARELDRERLGFVSDEAPDLFRFDTSLPGNRNTGHVYPPQGLSPDERRAIIEYLKRQ